MNPSFSKPTLLIALALILAGLAIIFLRPPAPDDSPDPDRASRSSAQQSPRHPTSNSRVRTVAAQLAPGLEIAEGTVKGESIEGPVVVTGSLPPSNLIPQEPAGDLDTGQTFRMTPAEDGILGGAFTIKSHSARVTSGGVRFEGPLQFFFENEVGRRYEIVLSGENAFYFISTDGLRQILSSPDAPRITGAHDQ